MKPASVRGQRHGHARGRAPLEQVVAAGEAGLLAHVRDGERLPRLRDGARDGGPRAGGGAEQALRPGPRRGADDELLALEDPDHGGVGPEQVGRLPGHVAEHDDGVEAGGEQGADMRDVLRERARAALALEQLAALERAARGAAQVLGEPDVLVGERPAAAEEDGDGVRLVAHAGDGRAEERAVALRQQRPAQRLVEAVVGVELARGENRLVGPRAGKGHCGSPPSMRSAHALRQLVASRRERRRRRGARGRERRLRPGPRTRPGRGRPGSARGRGSSRAPGRSGRSPAAPGPGARAPRSSPRCGARARRSGRTPPRPRCRPRPDGRARGCRRRERLAPRPAR